MINVLAFLPPPLTCASSSPSAAASSAPCSSCCCRSCADAPRGTRPRHGSWPAIQTDCCTGYRGDRAPHGGATKSAGTHLQCRGIDWQKRHRSAIKLINVNAADPLLELKQHRNAALASGDSQLIVLPIADTRRE